MAEVKRVDLEKPTKWIPFVTITLSKREAAGVHVLLGGTHNNDIGIDDLYYQIDSLFDDDLGESYLPPTITIKASEEASVGEYLDEKFGKV